MSEPLASEPIAIIGMACMFPSAPDLQTFWQNILHGVDAISEPEAAWDAPRYLESGRIKTASGGYLKDLYRFDPRDFGIMPSSLDGGEPDQFLALKVTRDALLDGGYLDTDHTDTGVILGHSTYLHRGQGTLIQNHIVVDQTLELLQVMCPHLGPEALAEIRSTLSKTLPASTADIAPGLVPNVMTGRIANRLNLKGPNYLIDAACSSSLLAISAAMDELRAGRCKMMLAGGVNASLPAEVAVIFTQLGALSGRGKVRPFEEGSDGTLLGEGLGVVLLKRQSDALADGDRVYAVLHAVGQASDGRGQGLLAPSIDGETLAIRRAYEQSGVDPRSVSLIEAHGTGIPLGDKTEVASLKNVFGSEPSAVGSIAIGSVKSMISHCIPAAGAAGIIKTALALHHKVLPPTLCETVNPALGIESPLFVSKTAAPWLSPEHIPRRAGVNSFGFGGINTHAILEQAPSAASSPLSTLAWRAELCVLSADSREELLRDVAALEAALALHPEWTASEVAKALWTKDRGAKCRLAITAADTRALLRGLGQAVQRLTAPKQEPRFATRNGCSYSESPLGGQLAFVFPGEGSQYPHMLAELAMTFSEVRSWLDFWAGLYGEAPGHRRTDIAFPPAGASAELGRALDERLHDMDVGSEAVFIGGQAMFAVLSALGVTPDVMLGHSSGESSALAASGAIGGGDRGQLGESIRQLNAVYRQVLSDRQIPTGSLLAVGALDAKAVAQLMSETAPEAVVAMDNCKNQLVLYGPPESMELLERALADAGAICLRLPFNRGYHTPAFEQASRAFLEYYREIGLGAPQIPLYSCATAELFSSAPGDIQTLAAAQWSSKVRFRETIETMHERGVRTFVEVGPGGNLTSFIGDILGGKEYLVLPSNLRKRGDVEQLLTCLGQLYADARPLNLARLWGGRQIATVELDAPLQALSRGIKLDNTMPRIRLSDAARARLGALAAPPAGQPVQALPAQAPSAQALPASEPFPAPAPDSAQASLAEANLESATRQYFDLMNTFLERQAEVVTRLQGLEERSGASLPGSTLGFLAPPHQHDEGGLKAYCHLSIQHQQFLQHHVLSGPVSGSPGYGQEGELLGLSCVPLMVSLEILAQASALLAGRSTLAAITNVTAYDWIALDSGELTLEAEATTLDEDQGTYRATLHGPGGIAVCADFTFLPAPPSVDPLAPLTEHRPSIWNGAELYTTGMFHGPLFQSIRHIHGWDPSGMDADLTDCALEGFFVPGERSGFVTNPILLDAMGQLAAYWISQQVGTDFNCFPSTIERIEFYADCPEVAGTVLRARQRPVDPNDTDIAAARAWDFECLAPDGTPLVRVRGLLNIYFPVPHRFYETRRDPLLGFLGEPPALEAGAELLLWQLPLLPLAFCAQSGGIFLRILALAYLAEEERSEWQRLTGSVRQRREWLLGRACLKEAVRHWIYRETGQLLYSTDVIVRHHESGAPFVDGAWNGSLAVAPEVSLSHDSEVCLAAVTDASRKVGIDREHVGRLQKPELLVEALTLGERTMVDGLTGAALEERLLRIWCAKEAAAKWVGTGLQGNPSSFEVRFCDAAFNQALIGHDSGEIYVDIASDYRAVVALACN